MRWGQEGRGLRGDDDPVLDLLSLSASCQETCSADGSPCRNEQWLGGPGDNNLGAAIQEVVIKP